MVLAFSILYVISIQFLFDCQFVVVLVEGKGIVQNVLTLRTISEMCVNASSPVLVLRVFKYAKASSTDIPAMISCSRLLETPSALVLFPHALLLLLIFGWLPV